MVIGVNKFLPVQIVYQNNSNKRLADTASLLSRLIPNSTWATSGRPLCPYLKSSKQFLFQFTAFSKAE
jgi:hypothetical protein